MVRTIMLEVERKTQTVLQVLTHTVQQSRSLVISSMAKPL
jgi:hypothetical protein